MPHILSSTREAVLLGLQILQVVHLWVHDWVPLGRLNDVAAVRRQDSRQRLAIVTLIQSLPFTIGLVWSFRAFGHPYPEGLFNWLAISYGILFLGELRAWWFPYLLRPEPVRAVRYREMFGNTHTFLPTRNGIAPNTMHLVLHLATAATLLVLFAG